MLDKKLLSILACPVCKGSLKYVAERNELVCRVDGLAFAIKDGFPDMVQEDARALSVEEKLGDGNSRSGHASL